MSDLHTQARDEAARLRAAGDDGAADLVDALRKESEGLREALRWVEAHPYAPIHIVLKVVRAALTDD